MFQTTKQVKNVCWMNPTPLKNVISSLGMMTEPEIPNRWKNRSHVPNYQPNDFPIGIDQSQIKRRTGLVLDHHPKRGLVQEFHPPYSVLNDEMAE